MLYALEFTDKAKDDIEAFRKAGQRAILYKLLHLLNEVSEHPFIGKGKPELLKYGLSGCWSRRINKEHRLIYQVKKGVIFILSTKGHYL